MAGTAPPESEPRYDLAALPSLDVFAVNRLAQPPATPAHSGP